jgi:hypothetical protein
MHREKIEKNQRNFFFVEMHKKPPPILEKHVAILFITK